MPSITQAAPATTEAKAPSATFKEDLKGKPALDNQASMYLSQEKGSNKLHPEESQFEAYGRINNRVFGQMLPWKQKWDIEAQEVQDAFEGVMNESKVFPLAFMAVDAKLSTTLAAMPKVVFEMDADKPKLPMIERLYNHFTSDVEDGFDEWMVNYIWHLYNELYGWAVKRIWHEVDMMVEFEPEVVTDDDGNIVYEEDSFAKIDWCKKQWAKGKTKQRVYTPDMVALSPGITFQNEAFDIVFMEDMNFDMWSQKFNNNPMFENTEKVRPGQYYTFNANTYVGEDTSTNQLVLYDNNLGLDEDKVRHMEYYSLARDEYYVQSNGHWLRHTPNPTPPVNGRKVLPFSMLQNRPRPGTYCWKAEAKLVEPFIVIWQKLMASKAKRAELSASPIILTDMPSGLAPKSFKVVPGAHWRGMKGRVDTLNLAGVDTGEADKYIEQLNRLWKGTTGVDFDRFIQEPDPTLGQQLAREGAEKLRTEKDASRQERDSYVRSAQITLAHLMFYTPIPEIANIEDLSEEEQNELQDFDKIDAKTYYKYPKLPVKDKMYIENYIPVKDGEEGDGRLELIPYTGMDSQKDVKMKAKSYIFCRPQYMRTKAPVRVRIVSNRKQATNRALRRDDALYIVEQAFNLPPKNEFEIQTFKPSSESQTPPKPKYYINREKSISNMLDAMGQDTKEMTSDEDSGKKSIAVKMLREALGDKPPTLAPDLGGAMESIDPRMGMISSAIKRKRVPSEQNAAPVSPAAPTPPVVPAQAAA